MEYNIQKLYEIDKNPLKTSKIMKNLFKMSRYSSKNRKILNKTSEDKWNDGKIVKNRISQLKKREKMY